MSAKDINLIGSNVRVSVPFVKVTFGDEGNGYTFGVYDKANSTSSQANQAYSTTNVKYPNYIQSLEIQKINGQVNRYTLNLSYQITPDNDPNFFEKVFSTISDSRKIIFSYGDLSVPTYLYRDEEAIVTEITSSFAISSARVDYTIKAISSCDLLNASSFTFQAKYEQPSKVILDLLKNKKYGLQEIFYGMRDIDLVETNNLISRDDRPVNITMKTNISILDYLTYLVSCMTPTGDVGSGLSKSGMYVLNVVDDVSGIYKGPYFTVKKLSTSIDQANPLETYTIDIGYPSANIVTSFQINDNENWSIYYNYSNKISTEQYNYRINNEGKLAPVYAPTISSNNNMYKTTEADRSWWTSVTEYPISATLVMKGLLRPALLMTYVKLNVYYFGKKHISSGLYVITKQVDRVDYNGFQTTLSLLRVGADKDTDYVSDVANNKNNSNSKDNSKKYHVVNSSTK